MTGNTPKWTRARFALWPLWLLAFGVSAASAGAQETTGAFRLGFFSDYPRDFGGSCQSDMVGLELGLARSVTPAIAVEGGVTWTGSTATSCPTANDALSLPAPLDGSPYSRTVIDARIVGETFFATRVGALFAPWRGGIVTPRFRVSAGRMWNKGLWTWMGGTGLRYGGRGHAITLDLERWHLGYDVLRETWIFSANGPDTLQSRETLERRPRPWFLRLGWEFAIGG